MSLFLHDINDIFFEGGKFLYYTKLQNNQVNVIFKVLHELMWVLFVILWLITRLYIFPLNVIAFILQKSLIHQVNRPSFALLIGLSWITNAMNVYWFTVIINLNNFKRWCNLYSYFSGLWWQFSEYYLAKVKLMISVQKMTRNISNDHL